jgi:hypothetical protein
MGSARSFWKIGLALCCALPSLRLPTWQLSGSGAARAPASEEEAGEDAQAGSIPPSFATAAAAFRKTILGPEPVPEGGVPEKDAGLITRAADPKFGVKAVHGQRGSGQPRTRAMLESYQAQHTKRFEEWGLKLRDWAQGYVSDANRDKVSRLLVLRLYFDSILHSWRAYVVAVGVKPGVARPLDDWQLDVPLELVAEGSSEERFLKIASGQNEVAPGIAFRNASGGSRRSAFDPYLTIARDVGSYMRVVSTDNYVRALKLLTISMVVGQIRIYNGHLGLDRPVDIPVSCSADMRDIPRAIRFPPASKEERNKAVEGILQSAGLFTSNNELYKNYWQNTTQADPRTEGFTGYLPFEKLRTAQKGLEWKPGKAGSITNMPEPALDDFENFQDALFAKEGALIDSLSDSERELLRSMYEVPENGSQSKWLEKELQATGKSAWWELLPKSEVATLESTRVTVDLPPLDGPDSWRRWGLRELALWAERTAASPMSFLMKTEIGALCNSYKKSCKDLPEHLRSIRKFLAPFVETSENLPKVVFDEPALRKEYPYYAALWSMMRDNGRFKKKNDEGKDVDIAAFTAFEIVETQIHNTPPNPWALLMVALRVEAARYKGGSWWKLGGDNPWAKMLKDFQLDRGLRPMHATKVLTADEKRAVWSRIAKEWSEGTNYVLDKKVSGEKERSTFFDTFSFLRPADDGVYDGRTGWDRIAGIQDRALLTPEQVEKAITDFRVTGKKVREEVAELWASPDGKLGRLLYKIYQAQGDVAEQERILREEGPEFDLTAGTQAKESILTLDLLAKTTLFRRITVEGSMRARQDAQQVLDRLCSVDWKKDSDEFKRLVLSTMTVQKDLNQKYGLPKPPPEVQKAIDAWFKEDQKQLALGLAQGGLAVGAVLALGSCVPPLFCVPALIMGVASVAIGVPMTVSAFQDVDEADRRESFAKTFAAQGLTDDESVKKFRNNAYGYLETVFNAVSTLPMVGVPVRATALSGASMKAAVAVWARNGSKAEMEAVITATRSAVNAQVSRYWLGLLRADEQLGKAAVEAPGQVKAAFKTGREAVDDLVRGLSQARDFSSFEAVVKAVTSKVVKDGLPEVLVKESAQQIDGAFAKTVSKEFAGQPKKMADFFREFAKKTGTYEAKLELVTAKRASIDDLAWLQRMWRRARFPKWRQDRLMTRLKSGQSLGELVKELDALPAERLEEFVVKNADRLSDLVHELPFRMRELPFYVLAQGTPGGIKVWGVRTIARSVLLKEVATAREILLFEKAKNTLQVALGMSGREALKTVNYEKSFFKQSRFGEIYADFRETVNKQGHRNALRSFEDGLAQRVADWAPNSLPAKYRPQQVSDYARVLFDPVEPEERALSETLWSLLPKQVVFGEDFAVKKVAGDLVESLKGYDDMDQFDDYFSALRTLVSMKMPGELAN